MHTSQIYMSAKGASMAKSRKNAEQGRLFARLKSSQSGNASMLMAAAIIPLIGMIGGGFDMGRMYASKTRLQHACDAAVLAGRKAMIGNSFSAANKSTAERFFLYSFPDGKYGTRFPAQDVSGAIPGIALTLDNGQLAAQAEALVPMTLMAIFGQSERPISADCKANLNLPNSDIMFVLDTTGSMLGTNAGDTQSRMTSMRGAVSNFHTSLSNANSAGARVRYGFVPYSTTVNVGYLLEADWLVSNWTYQSRVADDIEVETISASNGTNTYDDGWTAASGSWTNLAPTALPVNACTAPADTVEWDGGSISTTTEPYSGPPAGTKTIERRFWSGNGIDYWVTTTKANYESAEVITGCTLHGRQFDNYVEEFNRNTVPTATAGSTANAYYWNYKPVVYDVSALKGITSGGSITAQIGNNHTMKTVNWQGCIEERHTVATDNYDPIPGGAYDMDIDRVPVADNPQTQWRPSLPGLVFARMDLFDQSKWSMANVKSKANTQNLADYASTLAACPSPARKLSEISAGDLNSYLASLNATGLTYHDIGLTWGARLMSPTGLFAAENATAPNGNSIARHMIFMTDGEIDTQPHAYDSYGWGAIDRRRNLNPSLAPTKAEQDEQVALRTEAMCKAIKAKGITVWVIAFGTDLTSLLSNCASDGKAFEADNTAQLNSAFSEIAAGISQLRLTR
jgi:Putative Flp pilus-assembly TadE/G-like